MPISWPDDVDRILGGDLTAGLAYVTPARGTVVAAVAPVGLRDRDAGTFTFTTSLGLGRKLERLEHHPHVALAYHAREHGLADGNLFVLVQGRARPIPDADEEWNEKVLGPASVAGPAQGAQAGQGPRRGLTAPPQPSKPRTRSVSSRSAFTALPSSRTRSAGRPWSRRV